MDDYNFYKEYQEELEKLGVMDEHEWDWQINNTLVYMRAAEVMREIKELKEDMKTIKQNLGIL